MDMCRQISVSKVDWNGGLGSQRCFEEIFSKVSSQVWPG